MLRPPTCVIENVQPLVEGGRYAVKRAVGEDIAVEADVFKDGHDVVSAVLKWRKRGTARWYETPMTPIPKGNDRWCGTFSVFENAVYEFTVEAWGDTFLSWQHEFHLKFAAALPDLKSETLEGAAFVEKAARRAQAAAQKRDAERLLRLAEAMRAGSPAEVNGLAHSPELEGLMTAYPDRAESTEYLLNLPPVGELVDAPGAGNREPAPAAKQAKATRKNEAVVTAPAPRRTRRSAPVIRSFMWTAPARPFRNGMSFFRAPRRDAATRARPSATACRASTTRRRWAST